MDHGLWTPEQDALLIKLLAEGLTYRRCGAQMVAAGFPDRSRNALIGRARRLGLSQPKPKKDADRRSATETSTVSRVLGRKAAVQTPAVARPRPEERAPAPAPVALPPARVPVVKAPRDRAPVATRFLELRAGDGLCRWPLWPDHERIALERKFVCGAPALPGTSWCPACSRLAGRPVAEGVAGEAA